MASSTPSTPPPAPSGTKKYRPSPSPPPNARKRLPSSDIPRTYSGLYGTGGDYPDSDLLPFELTRNRNTDWLDMGGPLLLTTYVAVILGFQIFLMAFLPLNLTWTVTNVLHGFVTMLYLHWIKGSPNFYEQGEMNGMTLWEQLDSRPSSEGTASVSKDHQKRALLIVPTLLCYAGCHFGGYGPVLSLTNVFVWVTCVLAKMPFMNGVRIMGINRTAGIDDDRRKRC